jgi:alanine racemase
MKAHIAIHAANLLHNLQLFNDLTRRPIMFVVKANAYGHGLRPPSASMPWTRWRRP